MMRIIKMTWQERFDNYMLLPKEELARMLAEAAKIFCPEGCAELQESTTDAKVKYTKSGNYNEHC